MIYKIGKMKDLGAKKWFENYWFYYKWHTIGILAAIIVVSVFIGDLVNKEKFDYNVIIAARGYFSPEQIDTLETRLEQAGKDIDGDGQVKVNILEIALAPDPTKTDPAMESTLQMKLMAEISTEDSIVYLIDDKVFESIFKGQESAFVDLSKKYEDPKVDDIKFKLYESEYYKENDIFKTMPELSVYVRNYEPVNKDKKDSKKEIKRRTHYENAQEFGYKFIEQHLK